VERRRKEALVGIAGGQHGPRHPLRVVGQHPLDECATGVVGHQHHIGEVEGFEEPGDEGGHPGRAQVRPRPHRGRMGAEGPVRGDGPQPISGPSQGRHRLTPQEAVGEEAVHEHDGPAGTPLPVAHRAALELHESLGPQCISDGHVISHR
jgi:hypothetical protein